METADLKSKTKPATWNYMKPQLIIFQSFKYTASKDVFDIGSRTWTTEEQNGITEFEGSLETF